MNYDFIRIAELNSKDIPLLYNIILLKLHLCLSYYNPNLFAAPTRSPSNITVVSMMRHNSFQVSWQRLTSEYVYGDLKGYKIIYQLEKVGGKVIATSKKETKIIHPSLTQATLSELQPNAQYTFNVLAFNQHGDGKMSETVTGGK